MDVVLENHRTGTMEKWGLGWDLLSAINPGLVLVRVTGFGQTGLDRNRPGFGTLDEAYSGFVQVNGEPDCPPLLPGFGLADSTAGLMAAFLTSVALHERRASHWPAFLALAHPPCCRCTGTEPCGRSRSK